MYFPYQNQSRIVILLFVIFAIAAVVLGALAESELYPTDTAQQARLDQAKLTEQTLQKGQEQLAQTQQAEALKKYHEEHDKIVSQIRGILSLSALLAIILLLLALCLHIFRWTITYRASAKARKRRRK